MLLSNCRRHILRIAIGTILVIVTLVGLASAATLTVGPSGCDYTSIQAAISVANTGDTIEVQSGIYYENVDVDKKLRLYGVDTGGGIPIVDGSLSGSSITLNADGIMLEGFTVIHSWGPSAAGIKVASNNNTLIRNNVNSNMDGISLYVSSSNNTLINNNVSSNMVYGISVSDNNTLIGNSVSGSMNGIWSSGNNNTLIDNKVLDNHGDGIYVNSYCTLIDNIVNSNNNRGILISGSDNELINNTANSNDANGIYLSHSNNNTLSNNNASNNNGCGIQLSYSSNNTLSGNKVISNDNGVHIEGNSQNNLIYHNSIINNINQVYDIDPSKNNWHHPILLEGNNWSDYAGVDDGSGTGKHAISGDGIGDTLIPHPSENFDFYPYVYETVIPPIASFIFSPENPAIDEGITFNASDSYDQDGVIVSYTWNFGDGNITNTIDQTITHSYSLAGNYFVNLTVTDDSGLANSTTKSLNVIIQVPNISISTDSLQYSPGDTMIVTLNIDNPTTNTLSFDWYIGIPQLNTWMPYVSAPIPPGYSNIHTIPVPVGDWGSTPFGLVHYVHMLDSGTGEVLVQDSGLVSYSPVSAIVANSKVDIAKEIKKTKKKVELSI